MLLLDGSVAVAARKLGTVHSVYVLGTASPVLVFRSALLVAGAVVSGAVAALREGPKQPPRRPTDGLRPDRPRRDHPTSGRDERRRVYSFVLIMQILLPRDRQLDAEWPIH